MMFLPEMNRGVSVKKKKKEKKKERKKRKEKSGLKEKMCVWMGGKE